MMPVTTNLPDVRPPQPVLAITPTPSSNQDTEPPAHYEEIPYEDSASCSGKICVS